MQTEQRTKKDDSDTASRDTASRPERRPRNVEGSVRISDNSPQAWSAFTAQAGWAQQPYGPGSSQNQGFGNQGFGNPYAGYAGMQPGFGPTQGLQPFGPSAMGFPNPFAAIAPTLSYGLAGLADLVYRGVALATTQGQTLLTSLQAPGRRGGAQQVAWPQARLPATDIVDEGSELVCQLELPGVKPENVDVACHGRGILVTAHADPEIDLGALVQAERGLQATYRRAIPLPVTVQPSGAKARLRDGILTINVPKADPTEGPRRVNVE